MVEIVALNSPSCCLCSPSLSLNSPNTLDAHKSRLADYGHKLRQVAQHVGQVSVRMNSFVYF